MSWCLCRLEETEKEGARDRARRHWRLGLRDPRIEVHRLAAQLARGGQEDQPKREITRLMILPIPRGDIKEALFHAVKHVKSKPRVMIP